MTDGTTTIAAPQRPGDRWRRWARLAASGVALVALVSSSTVTIESSERGVIERFGRPVRDALPGIHLKLPWPFESVRRTAGPDRSLRMPIGYRLIEERLGFKPTARQKEWLTGDNNIVELKAELLYVVRDARAFLYGVSTVRSLEDDTVEPAEFALRRLAEATLTEVVGRLSVDDVLAGSVRPITVVGRDMIQQRADALGLGVEITELQLIERRPLMTVERAFRAVQDARSQADARLTFAQSSATKRTSAARNRAREAVSEARSEAARTVSEARASTAEFEAIRGVIGSLDTPSGYRLRLQKLRALLAGAEVQVVPAGSPDARTRVYPRSE